MSESELTVEKIREDHINHRLGPYIGWNKVNRAQVWQWCAAMGDTNPLYLENDEVIAPPTMLQMWTMRDVRGNFPEGTVDKNVYEIMDKFGQIGYSATVATNYDQTYHSYLKEGDQVYSYHTIVDVTDKKSTGLGEGYFVTEHAQYYRSNDEIKDELFGEARISYFKYMPPEQTPGASSSGGGIKKIERIRPVENHDSKHFWQGLREGKLLIQQCSNCQVTRHPPQPMCEQCQSIEWNTIESKCEGTIYSYTVMHYPEIPPFDYPNAIVLVDLDEDVRIASQLTGTKPDDIVIGSRVKAKLVEVQDEMTLPVFEVIETEASS